MFNPEIEKGLKDTRDNALQGKSVTVPMRKDPETGGQRRVFPAKGSVGEKFKISLKHFKKLKDS